jgi:hypothetical protein
MIEIAEHSIKGFCKLAEEANFVPPSEDSIFDKESLSLEKENDSLKAEIARLETPKGPIFTLTATQLEDIITRAIQPLNDRIDSLEATITTQAEKITGLEATQDTQAENQLIQLKLINDLKIKHEIGQTTPRGEKTKARTEQIKIFLKARGGSSTFKTIREHLRLKPNQFSRLVEGLDKRVFDVSKRPGSKTGEKILSLKVRILEPLSISREM